jgi:hypothetical protein
VKVRQTVGKNAKSSYFRTFFATTVKLSHGKHAFDHDLSSEAANVPRNPINTERDFDDNSRHSKKI